MPRKKSTPSVEVEYPKQVTNQEYIEREIIENALMTRSNLIDRLLDPRRDVDEECGYIKTAGIDETLYNELHDRHPIANRVNSILPKECWKISPEVYESEDNDEETQFEKDWKELCQSLGSGSKLKSTKYNPIWSILSRADLVSGKGHYGIILIGFSDGKDLREPVEGFEDAEEEAVVNEGTDDQYNDFGNFTSGDPDSGERKVLFLKVFDERLAEISEWNTDKTSPRFNQPLRYRLTLSDASEGTSGVGQASSTIEVHWSRVIHIADGVECNETIGTPRCRPVLNPLSDLKKIYGGGAEGYWQVCLPGVILESEPGTVIDKDAMKQGVQDYIHRMQRWLALSGMTAKTLQGSVTDPTSFIAVYIEAICIQLAVPTRIFMGSERGELASSQDKDSWDERLFERRENHVTPNIIAPLVDRLIAFGVLAEPEQYIIDWSGSDNTSKLLKAQIASTLTQALVAYISGGVDNLIEPADYLSEIIGWPQEKVKQFLKNTFDHMKKANPDMEGEPVPGKAPKEPVPEPLQDPALPPPTEDPAEKKKLNIKPLTKKEKV